MIRAALLLVVVLAGAGCLGGAGGLFISSEDPVVDPSRITGILADLDTARSVTGRLNVGEEAFREARLMSLFGTRGSGGYRAAALSGRAPVLRNEVLLAGASAGDREAVAVLFEVARVASARSRRRITPGRTIFFSLWDGDAGYNRLRNHPLISSSVVVGEIIVPGMGDGSLGRLEQTAGVYLDSIEALSFAPDSLFETL